MDQRVFGATPLGSSGVLRSYKGAFHLRRVAGNIAGKLVNAYLSYQNGQPATCFLITATMAMLAILVLPVKWKAPKDL